MMALMGACYKIHTNDQWDSNFYSAQLVVILCEKFRKFSCNINLKRYTIMQCILILVSAKRYSFCNVLYLVVNNKSKSYRQPVYNIILLFY